MDWDDASLTWNARWLPAPSVGAAALRRRMAESMPPAFRCWLAGDDLTGLGPHRQDDTQLHADAHTVRQALAAPLPPR